MKRKFATLSRHGPGSPGPGDAAVASLVPRAHGPGGWRLLALVLVLGIAGLDPAPLPALDIRFAQGATSGRITVPKGAPAPPAAAAAAAPAADVVAPGEATPEGRLEVDVDYVARLMESNVRGSAARSFQRDGFFNRHDVTTRVGREWDSGHYLNGQVFVLATDDPQIVAGGREVQVPGVFFEYGRRDDFDLRLGNVPVFYSPMTFSRQVDGLGARKTHREGDGAWDLAAVAARVQAAEEGRNYLRGALGTRAARRIEFGEESRLESVTVAGNAAWVDDNGGSLRFRDGVPLVAGSVVSVDARARFRKGLELEGEVASSDQEVRGEGTIAGAGTLDGNARRFSARYARDDWTGGADYEAFTPGFRSLVGAATSDLERLAAFVGRRLGEVARVQLNWSQVENNLDGQLPQSFESENLNATATIRPFAKSSSEGLQPIQVLLTWSEFDSRLTGLSDRETRTVSAGIGYNRGDVAASYTFRDVTIEDPLDTALDLDEDHHQARLAWRIRVSRDGRHSVTPSIAANLLESRVRATGAVTDRDFLIYGLAAELGPNWRFDFAQNVVAGVRPVGGATRSNRNFSRRASLQYIPDLDEPLRLAVQWDDRDLTDSLPGFDLQSNEVTAIVETRF